jgi:hypothetical protein
VQVLATAWSECVNSDPSLLQEIGDVASVFLVAGTLAAVYFAFKSAAAATRSADAQTRPLLSAVPREYYLDQEREIILPGREISKTAISGDIRANHEKGWISLPVRNTGKGLALIRRVQVEFPAGGKPREVTGGSSWRQVQPDEEVRITAALLPIDNAYERFKDTIATMEPVTVGVEYTDFAGRQPQISYFELGPLPGDMAWRVRELWTNEGAAFEG